MHSEGVATQTAHVPKFGNWDNNEQVPYTAVFESARVVSVGKLFNPNDPAENPAAFRINNNSYDGESPCQLHVQKTDMPIERKEAAPTRITHERGFSRVDGHSLRRTEPFTHTRLHESPNGVEGQGPIRSTSSEGHLKPAFADALRRSRRAGSMKENANGIDDLQGRHGNKPGSTSPNGERKSSSMRGRADDIVDRRSVLPKFGAWNENNPATAEGFTVIFNQARTVKKTGGIVPIPALQQYSPTRLEYSDGHKLPSLTPQHKQPSIWTCCFSSSGIK